MFKDSRAFSGYSVSDIKKARDFYTNVLGLTVSDVPGMKEFGMIQLHITHGQPILLYAKDDHKPATFTVLSFPVDAIDEAVDELVSKGIEMIRYDNPYAPQDEKGIMRGLSSNQGPDIAWFPDPSGNILAVLQEAK